MRRPAPALRARSSGSASRTRLSRAPTVRVRAAASVIIAAVTRDLPALEILVAGEHARSFSTIAVSGAYVVVVTTTVRALAYTLTSVLADAGEAWRDAADSAG